jgi:hypothetical protein
MNIVKETEKALLMEKDAVSFWIRKRWLSREGTLSKEGNRAYFIAAREHWKHFGFDALKEFTLVRETEKAALLRGCVERPEGDPGSVDFWLPKSMTGDWEYVSHKIAVIEDGFPLEGMRVKWSGMKRQKKGNSPRSRRGSAKAAVFSSVRS